MTTEIITVLSLFIALAAVLLTLWQNVLQRRAAQAQVFLHMLEQFNSDDVLNGSLSLSKLSRYDDLETFEQHESKETQIQIYKLVEFLNNTARLVWSGYLPRQRVWDLYFMIYRTAYEKLVPWWLDGQRARSYKQKFIPFEEMCLQVADIPAAESDEWDGKMYPHYRQRYRNAASAHTANR